MAVFSGTVRSAVLSTDTQLSVILPYDRPSEQQKIPCQVLYLLHGLGENCHAWCRYSGVERYARQYGIAVVMPEVQRSFYTNMHYGMHYFDYVATELPRICAEMFQVSTRREDTFVAGLSMGGYGALKCALSFPERYAGAASFSGAVNIKDILTHNLNEETKGEFTAAFGTELILQPENDLYVLACKAAASSIRPQLMITCGEQDVLWQMNLEFRDFLESIALPFRFESWKGAHDWDFWDVSLQRALNFFFSAT